jgi:hypothetical protein
MFHKTFPLCAALMLFACGDSTEIDTNTVDGAAQPEVAADAPSAPETVTDDSPAVETVADAAGADGLVHNFSHQSLLERLNPLDLNERIVRDAENTEILMATSKGGFDFVLLPAGCITADECRGLMLVATLQAPGVTLEDINTLNTDAQVLKFVMPEGGGAISIHQYVIALGGLWPENLDSNISVFADLIDGYGQPAPREESAN